MDDVTREIAQGYASFAATDVQDTEVVVPASRTEDNVTSEIAQGYAAFAGSEAETSTLASPTPDTYGAGGPAHEDRSAMSMNSKKYLLNI